MIKFDLHLHSNLSDGVATRDELISKMLSDDIKYISFTDHNVICECDNEVTDKITIINGVELDCTYENKKIHMLGYGVQNNIVIENALIDIAKRNDKICREMIEILNKKYNNIITSNDIKLFDNKLIKKRDIAVLLLNKFHGKNIDFVYNNFIGSKSGTYIRQEKLNALEVINLFSSVSAVSILAHPMTLYKQCVNDDEFEKIIKILKFNGLDGLEIVNPKNPEFFQDYLIKIGNKYDLIFTAGSDYHGIADNYSNSIDNEVYLIPLLNKIRNFKQKAGEKKFEKCRKY